MLALGTTGTDILGLFGDGGDPPAYAWEKLASMPAGQIATALFSLRGDPALVGTAAGRIQTWMKASKGLPRRPHGADMRFATEGQGGTIFLATYGRSLWTAQL